MRFPLNGRSSKLDYDDVHSMRISEPEIKMAAIHRKKLRSQLLNNVPTGIPKPKRHFFLWSRNTTGLIEILCNSGVSRQSKMAAINRKYI